MRALRVRGPSKPPNQVTLLAGSLHVPAEQLASRWIMDHGYPTSPSRYAAGSREKDGSDAVRRHNGDSIHVALPVLQVTSREEINKFGGCPTRATYGQRPPLPVCLFCNSATLRRKAQSRGSVVSMHPFGKNQDPSNRKTTLSGFKMPRETVPRTRICRLR